MAWSGIIVTCAGAPNKSHGFELTNQRQDTSHMRTHKDVNTSSRPTGLESIILRLTVAEHAFESCFNKCIARKKTRECYIMSAHRCPSIHLYKPGKVLIVGQHVN